MSSPTTPTTSPIHVLQRVIFPTGDDLDIVPLYVETDVQRGAALNLIKPDKKDNDQSQARQQLVTAVVGQTQDSVRFGERAMTDAGLFGAEGLAEAGLRRRAIVKSGRRVSFATYFNAFPASYWRRWSVVESVTLRLRLAGDVTAVVYRSNAKGESHPVETFHVESDEPQSIEVTLPLARFIDGGWYWFDLAAGAREGYLFEADWATSAPREKHGRLSVGITTFNRPDFLLDLLRNLGESAEALDLIDKVYVIDQGTDRVQPHPDFADAAKALGERLTVIEQPNLGGSGGFSRAMDETERAGTSEYVLLLDDDVALEPEGLLRATTFADLARRPTIVGGHMFSLHDRSVLHAFGETVAPYKWWWGAAPNTKLEHDFGRQTLRHTPWLHRRVDVDYNGWWMCLIPVSLVRELGLALPVFIKWDDAEYGLRARAAGYPTVSMPGVAVWHVPWNDKTDAVDWQAYYHLRNRLVAALLHSPFDRGGRIVAESAETQIQHLLSMQYSSAVLRLQAMEDVLNGPGELHDQLPRKTGELRELRKHFVDAQGKPDVEDFPAPRRRRPPRHELTGPTSKPGLLIKAAVGMTRQLFPLPEGVDKRPKVALANQDASWWTLANMDSALVSAADGASTAWYRRDPKQFRELAMRSARLHARLFNEWPELSARYRDAAQQLTSPPQWRQTFGISDGNADAPSGA